MATRDRLLAHYYDLEYASYDEDLDFYIQYALAMDPAMHLPVLELGCGTGRVSLALAQAGFRVVGVDRSAAMLEIFQEKARQLGLSRRVKTLLGDMVDLAALPTHGFNIAFCALNTFAYLETTEAQIDLLRAVGAKLIQHGILILDLTPPLPGLLPPGDGELLHHGSFRDSDRSIVHKFVTGVAAPSIQSHDVTILYDHEGTDGSIHRLSESVRFRWVGRYEAELLLRAAGYDVEKVYGSYELDEYEDNSERMILVART
jgi:SAM-dependent methyltransferase